MQANRKMTREREYIKRRRTRAPTVWEDGQQPEMDHHARQASSVYSDSFKLEDLLQRISEQTKSQQGYAVQALIEERDALRNDVDSKRRLWHSARQLFARTSDMAKRLLQLHEDATARIRHEQCKWKANCVAI